MSGALRSVMHKGCSHCFLADAELAQRGKRFEVRKFTYKIAGHGVFFRSKYLFVLVDWICLGVGKVGFGLLCGSFLIGWYRFQLLILWRFPCFLGVLSFYLFLFFVGRLSLWLRSPRQSEQVVRLAMSECFGYWLFWDWYLLCHLLLLHLSDGICLVCYICWSAVCYFVLCSIVC